MNITLQYFDSCPGWKVVEGRVKDIIETRSLQASWIISELRHRRMLSGISSLGLRHF